MTSIEVSWSWEDPCIHDHAGDSSIDPFPKWATTYRIGKVPVGGSVTIKKGYRQRKNGNKYLAWAFS